MLPFSQLDISVPRSPGRGYVRIPQTAGNHIRNRRLELKLTQKELGAQLGLGEATIMGWEAEKRIPHRKHLSKLKEVLGLTVPIVKRKVPVSIE